MQRFVNAASQKRLIQNMRLDRFLAKTLGESRKDIKKVIRTGKVSVNNEIITQDGFHVDTAIDEVVFGGEILDYQEFRYYLINKPAGYICANEDKLNPTIINYDPLFTKYNLHTVGRLDKDTTGALMLTNDGKLTHRLISPKHKIEKIYRVETDLPIPSDLVSTFATGFSVNDEYITLPAKLQIVSENIALVTLIEGKYHQVKRMFGQFGLKVVSLHRDQFYILTVDDLELGQFRELTKQELGVILKLL